LAWWRQLRVSNGRAVNDRLQPIISDLRRTGEVLAERAPQVASSSCLDCAGAKSPQESLRSGPWTVPGFRIETELVDVPRDRRSVRLVVIGPLSLFGVWQRGIRTIGIGLLLVATSVAAWFVPMLAHSGGWPGYLAASEIYANYWATPHGSVGQLLLGMRTNFDELTGYVAQSTGPMFALLLMYAIGRVLAPPVLRVRPRLGILFVWIIPAVAFYSIVHIGNLGYVLSILPALCILGAASIEAAASDLAGVLANRISARWFAVGLGAAAAGVSSVMFLGVAGPVTLHEIRDVDREFTGALPMVRPNPVDSTLVLAFDRYRQYDYYLPRYRRADHLVAASDLRQDRLGRATFQVPAAIGTIVLPDLYANSAETPGRVERVTGTDGAVIFVAHVQAGDQLRVGPGYARTVGH